MSDNPYQPPPIPLEIQMPRPVARSTFGRKVWLLLGLVIAPPMALSVYLLGLWLLSLAPLANDRHGLLPFAGGVLLLAIPIAPAYVALRWISHWFDAPDWWESLVALLSVVAAIGALIDRFH